MAATLHARGCAIVTDDVTAVDVGAECDTVFPGFPQLKLWPEAIVSLGETPETMPRLHPLLEKRARPAVRGFSHRLLPLRRLYVIAGGPAPAIEPLAPHEALIEILRHWYGSRFQDRLLRVNGTAVSHLRQCASLANRVPVRRLIRPPAFQALLELATLIEDDLARKGDPARENGTSGSQDTLSLKTARFDPRPEQAATG